jgi:hypothetical protein
MKRITIDLHDHVNPLNLSEFLKVLHNHEYNYIKNISIDYFSEGKKEKKKLEINDEFGISDMDELFPHNLDPEI